MITNNQRLRSMLDVVDECYVGGHVRHETAVKGMMILSLQPISQYLFKVGGSILGELSGQMK